MIDAATILAQLAEGADRHARRIEPKLPEAAAEYREDAEAMRAGAAALTWERNLGG